MLEAMDFNSAIEGAVRTNLMVDNQSAIALIKNHDNHKRTKHVALRDSYCREQLQLGRIEVKCIESTLQLADALTKAKSPVKICQYKNIVYG